MVFVFKFVMRMRDRMRRLNIPQKFQNAIFMLMMLLLCIGVASAKSSKEEYYRSFWYPDYHGERLAYCNKDETTCGEPIANAYCKVLGYSKIENYRIEHHVGRVHYFENEGECTGWKCDGFLFIDCQGRFKDTPHLAYQYRMKEFNYPRFEHHRVDWCYQEKQACGKRAAYAFCRKMAYSDTQSFEEDSKAQATKTLGDHVLCYGKMCKGFKRITCKR